MSIVHLNRIKTILENQVFQHIDKASILSEKPKISNEELSNIMLSQAFLLFTLKSLTGNSYAELSVSITDGFKDNGIDAIHYSKEKNTLYICQSKWIKKGKGGVDKGEILKFIKGVDDILKLDYSSFNAKVKNQSQLIDEVILSTNVQIKVILAYSGDRISDENINIISDKIADYNDTDEVIYFEQFNIKDAYTCLRDSVEGEPINADVDLYDWGYTNEPFKAYYGNMSCGQIASIADFSSNRIFSKNIRSFIGFTGINNEIVNTLLSQPENFFYLNNGIVLLCKNITKSPYNSGKRELGKFQLIDLSIVNGAQTVGAIHHAFSKQPVKVNDAKVFVKIISLAETPKNFDKDITVASNTQNKIEKRDFVSLDEEQKRLKNDFFLIGKNYHIKRDDRNLIKDDLNYYFEEATIALACFQEDTDLSTYAKREIGKLWEDSNYKKLFTKSLNVKALSNLIVVLRTVDQNIKKLGSESKLICSHGQYLLTNLVMGKIGRELLGKPSFNLSKYLNENFESDFNLLSKSLVASYRNNFSDNRFPLSIFKNFRYSRKMAEDVTKESGIPALIQGNLFD